MNDTYIAGLFEAEGNVGHYAHDTNRSTMAMTIAMTDEEVIEAVAAHWDVKPFCRERRGKKPIYRIRLRGFNAVGMLQRLYPYLNNRRRDQADEAFSAVETRKGIQLKRPTTQSVDMKWAAGLVDGDGSISRRGTLVVQMVDQDTIERLKRVLSIEEDKTYVIEPKSVKHQVQYRIEISNRSNLERVYDNLFPYMLCERKRGRIEKYRRGDRIERYN